MVPGNVTAAPALPRTFGERISAYGRWQQKCLYLAGGFGGLALFGDLAKDSFSLAPPWVRAGFITAVVAGAVLVGSSYAAASVPKDALQRQLDRRNAATPDAHLGDLVPDRAEFAESRWLRMYMWLGFCCLSLAALLLLTATWWQYLIPFLTWLRSEMFWISLAFFVVAVALTGVNTRVLTSARSANLRLTLVDPGLRTWKVINLGPAAATAVSVSAASGPISGAELPCLGVGQEMQFTVPAPALPYPVSVQWTDTRIRTAKRKTTVEQP
ncbi:hypothetical protein ACWCW7_21945 [Nocardia tengchongensis]